MTLNPTNKELEQRIRALEKKVVDRDQMVTALTVSEEMYRTIFNSINDAIMIHDAKSGRPLDTNAKMEELLGYDKEAFTQMRVGDWSVGDPKMVQEEAMRRIKAAALGSPQLFEWHAIKKNRRRIWLEVNLKEAVIIGNKCVLAVVRDIAKRKRAEKERTKLLEQLNQARKMESVGTLAGGVAHDFNNLLYVIVGNADLALEDIPPWNPVYATIEEIKTTGLRAAVIIKQLLDFSRDTTPALRPIGAVKLIANVLNLLPSLIPSNIEIKKNIPKKELMICADPIQINQVIINICINASQEMEKTGGSLNLSVNSTILPDDSIGTPNGLAEGAYVIIMIGDTGPGIEHKILERIFEPYFTTKQVGEGSGMGLAVVHGIIKSHGGGISVDSKPGSGTTISIFIPIATQKEKLFT